MSPKSCGSEQDDVTTTGTFAKARLLGYVLTETTDEEHCRWRHDRDRTADAGAWRLTKLMPDLCWLRMLMVLKLTRMTLSANRSKGPEGCLAIEPNDVLRALPTQRAKHSPLFSGIQLRKDLSEDHASTTTHGLVVRQAKEVDVGKADLPIQGTTKPRVPAHQPLNRQRSEMEPKLNERGGESRDAHSMRRPAPRP